MIINQICNAWEHESSYLSLSLALIRFRLFALPNDPKINHNTSSSKGQNDDGNETLSALPHVGKRGRQLGGGNRQGKCRYKCGGRVCWRCALSVCWEREIFLRTLIPLKEALWATPLPPQAFYVPHGAWPMEFVLHTLRGDSVAHSRPRQHQHTRTVTTSWSFIIRNAKRFCNCDAINASTRLAIASTPLPRPLPLQSVDLKIN